MAPGLFSTINILGHMKFPTANFSILCFVTTKLPDSWYFFFSFANTKSLSKCIGLSLFIVALTFYAESYGHFQLKRLIEISQICL